MMTRKRGVRRAGVWVLMVLVMGAAAGQAPPAEPADSAPAGIVLRATGSGIPPRNATGPQARLMAERAATLVALRNLAVKLGRARTDVQTGVIDVEAFLAGYRVSDVRYSYHPDDTLKEVEATVEISLDRLYGNVEAVLRAQLDEANARRLQAQAEAARAAAERDRLAAEAEALRRALAEAQNRLNVAANNAAAAEAAKATQVADLQATIAALRKEVAELKAELDRLRNP